MDTNRLTRFTVAGWAFALSWPLQSWIFGIDFNLALSDFSNTQPLITAVAAILIALTAGPILGFIMNTFAYGIMCLYRGGDPEFNVPDSEEAFKQYIRILQNLNPMQEIKNSIGNIAISIHKTSGSKWWQLRRRRLHKKHIDKLIPYFNVQFHGLAPSTLIEHATRRWTIYWMYANSICAMISGTLFAFATSGDVLNREITFDHKFWIEIALGVFVSFGIWSMVRIPKQIYALVFSWLYCKDGSSIS